MLAGVYSAQTKTGTLYFRSSINYKNKHISLGSFPTEKEAHQAYVDASKIFSDASLSILTIFQFSTVLDFSKTIILLNFRDHGVYIKTPIYLQNNYFTYYLSPKDELKFDIDDLFYYSSHRIIRRQGHLYVNDYGMQTNLLSRYGIRNYAVAGKDYQFSNGDSTDYRYSNLILINHYYGVTKRIVNGTPVFRTHIHINGNYLIGTYPTESIAAVAYNKAADLAKEAGLEKGFQENYILEYSPKEYADIYTDLKISKKYIKYLQTLYS